MTIKKHEGQLIIDALKENVIKGLDKHSDEIVKAYGQMQDMGGLPISIGIKLQGDSTQVKSIVNISFMMEKVKETFKETIELKQEVMDFDEKKGKGKSKGKAKGKKKKEADDDLPI